MCCNSNLELLYVGCHTLPDLENGNALGSVELSIAFLLQIHYLKRTLSWQHRISFVRSSDICVRLVAGSLEVTVKIEATSHMHLSREITQSEIVNAE